MSKNSFLGLLIVGLVAAIIGGAFFFVAKNQPTETGPTTVAPEAPPPAPPLDAPAPTAPAPVRQAAAPSVTTDSGTAVSNSTAVVTGRVTPNGAQTTYRYDYGRTAELDTHTPWQAIGSGFVAIPSPAYITGLSPNTLYYFRLSAKNSLGMVTGVMYSFTTNSSTPPPQGNAPTTHTDRAVEISRNTANPQGLLNPNGSQTSYWFEYGESTDLGNTTSFQSAGNGTASTVVSVSLSNLKPLTTYYFRLNAQNQYGTVNGAILNFTTTGPPQPTAPSVSTDSANQIATSSARLNGHVNPNGAPTDYWFEYGTDPLLGSTSVSSTQRQSLLGYTAGVAVTSMITDLNRSTNYYYRTVASNSYGTVRGNIRTLRTR